MAAKKKSAAAIAVPPTYSACNDLVHQLGDAIRELNGIGDDLKADVAQRKAAAETRAEPVKARINALVAQIEAYGSAHRDDLTDQGKVKSHKMPAGTIGWRFDPPSVKFKKGFKEADVIATLKEMRLARFLRRTFTVNKQKLLDEPEKAATIPGIRIAKGKEAFFVDPVGIELSEGAPEGED
jgi:phage host-nuclease inhibitor protein Gam